MATPNEKTYNCGFCGKSSKEIAKLIIAPEDDRIAICNQCVEVCQGILLRDRIEKMQFKLVMSDR